MIIHLKKNIRLDVTLPIGPVSGFTSSALPLEFVDIPGEICGAAVVAVAVTVTNADGVAATAPCEHADGVWRVIFAASCFEHYGYVESGVSVALTLRDGSGNERRMVLAVGDLEVKRSSPSAAPGDPGKSYQIKGEDIYVKTRVIDGVQHYARQEMSYDAEMGAWGADWLGDYILVDGEFVPFQAAGGTAATVATALLALLLVPFSAFGITATKEYVDRKDGEIAALSTNIVTTATIAVLDAASGYTDTAIAQLPAWAKAESKPTYTASEISLADVWGETVQQFASNIDSFLGSLPSPSDMLIKMYDGRVATYSGGLYHPVEELYIGDHKGATVADIDAAISPTSPAFSNAVLSVGLGIDTNTVAVINELVDSAHDLPVTGATSVGALLLALAAAVAALKKKFGYDTEDSAASATIALSTRSFPVVDATAKTSADTIAVTMPSSAADGKVSDMCLRIDTGASVPALTFDLSANVFIPASGDDAWGTLEASSHNVFSFTSSGTQTVAVTDAANGNAVTNVTKRVWVVGRVTAAIVAAETINESAAKTALGVDDETAEAILAEAETGGV